MKRAYNITFSIIKTADIWVLADSEESAKESVKRNYQRIESYHYDDEVEEPECLNDCSILEVPDDDPLYYEDFDKIGKYGLEYLKKKALKEEGGEE